MARHVTGKTHHLPSPTVPGPEEKPASLTVLAELPSDAASRGAVCAQPARGSILGMGSSEAPILVPVPERALCSCDCSAQTLFLFHLPRSW